MRGMHDGCRMQIQNADTSKQSRAEGAGDDVLVPVPLGDEGLPEGDYR